MDKKAEKAEGKKQVARPSRYINLPSRPVQHKSYDDLHLKKTILFSDEARLELQAGIDLLADAVRTTLGPVGGNVGVERQGESPLLTSDGTTICEEISLGHRHRNMGVQLLRQVAAATQKSAGDGATMAIVLAQAIVREGFKNIAAGANPMLLRRGLLKGGAMARLALSNLSQPLETRADMIAIATLASGDPEIGEIVGDVIDTLGEDGVVWIYDYRGLDTQVEIGQGLYWKNGYVSPRFITDPNNGRAELKAAAVLITDGQISRAEELIPIMERLVRAGQFNLLIIAEGVLDNALGLLVANMQRGKFNCLAVKPPSFGELRQAMLSDLAVATGATLFSKEMGRSLQSATLDDLGHVSQAVATLNRTTLTGGHGSTAAVEARVAEIRTLMEQTEDKTAQGKLQQRLAALKDGVATIRVGGLTKAQRKERERFFKKALAAVRGAVEEGIQPGGGVAFLNVIPVLEVVEPECMEEAAALRCLERAFEAPLRQLAANAGQDGAVVVEEVCRRQDETRNPFIGYDVLRREFGDLREWGILDSTRMARTVVQNAISAASILLTVEATVGVVPGQGKAIRYQLNEEAEKRDLWQKKQRYAMKRRRRLGRQKPPKRVW